MRKEITTEELNEISAAYCNGKEHGHIGLIQAMSMSARPDAIYATVCSVKGYTIEYKVVTQDSTVDKDEELRKEVVINFPCIGSCSDELLNAQADKIIAIVTKKVTAESVD